MTAAITFHDGYWYCYANATAMLLGAHGEDVAPQCIEVLSGVGLGAFIAEDGLPFFSGLAGAPDAGITRALAVLGFAIAERAAEASDPVPSDWLAAPTACPSPRAFRSRRSPSSTSTATTRKCSTSPPAPPPRICRFAWAVRP